MTKNEEVYLWDIYVYPITYPSDSREQFATLFGRNAPKRKYRKPTLRSDYSSLVSRMRDR